MSQPSDRPLLPHLPQYIAYARAKAKPLLTEGAMQMLQNYYVKIRQGLVEEEAAAERAGRAQAAVPITVRQLEAIIRIAESCAKMRLSEVATLTLALTPTPTA